MKAILLIRVSSQQQELDEQTSNLIQFAKSEGFNENDLIVIEDKESAIKLSEEERNGLNRMKEYISNDSSITTIYVWELSRLTRIPTTAYSLRDYFINNHIQLKCYSPNFQLLKSDRSDLDDNGSLLFALYVQMAESEMRNKKARFKRSKIRNANTGKYSGGVVKFGYYVDDNGYYQINEKEAELIRYTFNRYEEGISILKLNKELLERGLINSDCFVNETLKCEAYTGISNKYKMNRIYPQIISVEQFERCKQIKKTNNKNLNKTKEIYFGKGLIKCTCCGATYMGMKSTTQYLCYNKFGREQKLDKTKACRDSAIININVLDTILFEACVVEEAHYIMHNSTKVIEDLENQIKINNEKIEAYQNKIDKAEQKKERNNDMFLMGAINKDKFVLNNKSIEDDVKEHTNSIADYTALNQKLQQTIIDRKSVKKDFSRDYQIAEDGVYSVEDLEEKQRIIQRHIKEVNIVDEVPNHSKLVNIFFYSYPNYPLQYRVYHKAKPQRIEMNETFYDDDADETSFQNWVDVNFKIEKRFVR